MKLFLRLLKETKSNQALYILSILLSGLAGIFGIFQARQVSKVINQIFLKHQGANSVLAILVMLLFIILLRALFAWGGERSAIAAARHIKLHLIQRFYGHLMDLGPAYLRSEAGDTQARTGELVNLSTQGMDALEIFFSQYIPQVVLAALIPVIILVFVFTTDLISGVVMLVTAPLLPLFMYLMGSAAQNLTHKQWQGLSRMSAYFLDVIQGITTLKTLGRSRSQATVIGQVSERYRQVTMSVLRVTFLSALVLELIATLSTAVIAVEVGIRLLYGKLAFEQAFFVLLLAPEFYLPLRLLGTRFHAGMAGTEAARRVYEILDLPAQRTSSLADQDQMPDLLPPLTIELNNVTYTYSDQKTALDKISFTIPAGKITALAGASGAGKSTLAWLILRFLQPSGGEILVNGQSLSAIPINDWLEKLAWVPQNPYLFNDTVAANIKLARQGATDAEVIHAAQQAHADEFISQLPQGYSTLIGERGSRLSAGQAQRIALARAFLKNSPLLILDEATSHLDPELDAELQESITRLAQERTVLVIAHRRSTLDNADQVVFLSHGHITQIRNNQHSYKPVFRERYSPAPLTYAQSNRVNEASFAGAIYQDILPYKGTPILERLLKLLLPYKGRIVLSVFLGFATISSSIGLMATAAYIISAAALHPSIADLQVAIVGVRFFGLSRGVFRYLERLVSHDVTFRLLARWRVWFYQALEPLAPARLLQYHSGDLLSRVMADIASLENLYVRVVSPPLVALLISTMMCGFMLFYGVDFAGLLLVFLLLAGLGLPAYSWVASKKLGQRVATARAEFTSVLVDGIQGLPDVLTSSQGMAYKKRVTEASDQLANSQDRLFNLNALQSAIGNLLANLAMLSVLSLAVVRVAEGRLDGVLIGTIALAALTSFEAVLPLAPAAQAFNTESEAGRRLYALVDTPPAVNEPTEPLPLPQAFDLQVKNLFFKYPLNKENDSAEHPEFVLSDITFSLPAGRHIAIVGPSGAGKSTLISLLLRYWDYQRGDILLNGNDLRAYSQGQLHQRIATISQNTYIFSASIRENLLLANPQATEVEMIAAAQAAQLHERIQSLPEQYNTWIGEHGLRFSAGERQRLAIARALLKDAPLLLMDEPTAHLDPATETAILDAIKSLSSGRSSILITQQMSNLETMDEILVMESGQIIERGKHAELISYPSQYKKMWDTYNQIL